MNRSLGLWAAAATGVQVGLALLVTRALAGQVGPMTLAMLRYAVGVAVLLPVFLARPRVAVPRGDLWPILGLGVVQFGVLIVLLNLAVTRISAGQAAIIFALFPLLTLLMSGRAGMGAKRVLGTLLSFAGVALCLGGAEVPADWIGAGLAFAAALAGAICAILYRPYLQRYPTLQVGTRAMVAAVLALLPLALFEATPAEIASLPWNVWAGVVFIGLSSGAGYLLWLTALRHAPASEATLFLGLSPIVAGVGGRLFLGETLGAGFVLGLALALAGLMLALTQGAGKGLAIMRGGS